MRPRTQARRTPSDAALQQLSTLDASRPHPGHRHFWDRAFSRRQFMQAAGAAAGVLGAGHWTAAGASVPGDFPTAIPGGFMFPPLTELFHNHAPNVFDPPDTDPSGIFNFNGQIGYAIIDGRGTGHPGGQLFFEVDLRFMKGVYVATNGHYLNRTFCLI
jgi:hypothetical protein